MTIPSIFFAIIVASLYGTLYHFFRDGGFWRLMYCLGLSMIGFGVGHLVGLWQGWFIIHSGRSTSGFPRSAALSFLSVGIG